MGLFILNLILNVDWSLVFFNLHLVGLAIFVSVALGASVLVLIILLWPKVIYSALLLVPYLVWLCSPSFGGRKRGAELIRHFEN
ncbi:MAG: hypothetical protein COU81_02345 [Candidatus Portnoybacteria bacterium CG10_big_fil_rev_8_21_14_0_10_36_7]|uniref:Uncharacterized protein n=1 Tax=Candidatus Portnoybacteria bacterium CG10_big_fil_rev_8_21_14_0_10_36_7 TaxID=1974812 RepID=A0A2M8KDX9_9BACT|nr:MAG: hypothetical protein COU81_02345 [Candidatus Portnoybacteria bacterium CG10_big_fil_rev_8_21_14_0_10_36_7]